MESSILSRPTMKYRQCELEKTTCRGRVHRQVTWILEDEAILHKCVELKDLGTGVLDNDWKVVAIGKAVKEDAL